MHREGAVGSGAARAQQLAAAAGRVLPDRALIVAANRGPLSFTREPDGGFSVAKGAGGVVTAIGPLGRYADPRWVAATLSAGDRERAAEAGQTGGEVVAQDGTGTMHRLRFVAPDPAVYDAYYNLIANPLLWFLQHYLWDLADSPAIDAAVWRAWREGYVTVNRLFADAIVATAAGQTGARPPLVMLHDYHLYLCARLVRERLPEATIQHLVHLPWPDADYWQILPGEMRRAICDGLLGADIVGFQTPDHARRFIQTCAANLPDLNLDDRGGALIYGGRRVEVRAYPVALDTEAIRAGAATSATADHLSRTRPPGIERLIVRTDRADLSKNILRGFEAYRTLLERHPEWRGRVSFLALLNPSRLNVPQYAAYSERIEALAGEIGQEFGTPEWRPIDLVFADDYPRALAALRAYDVLLVNALFDGMNLVAKEGPLVNERDGVLVLSEGTGAFVQLGEDALAISPCDVEGTATALHTALMMPAAERARRATALRRAIEREDIVAWLGAQLDDIAMVEGRRGLGPGV